MRYSLKMQIVIAVLLVCCMVFTGSCSGPGKGGPKGRPGPGDPGNSFISTVFDTRPFNMNVDKLEPMYTGHNPELLYNNILKRKENNTRDPGETQEQYRARIGREISLPLIGALDFDSIYAFRITPKEIRYNEKDRVMKVHCILSPVFGKNGRNSDKRSFMVRYQPQLDNRYTITGKDGAKIEVEEIKFLEYAVVPANIGSFPVEKTGSPDAPQDVKEKNAVPMVTNSGSDRGTITGTVTMTPEDAKRFEGGIMALLVCKLAEPYISYEEISRTPTSEKPGVYLARYHYLHIRLLEIWFYDVMSGKIFKKMTAGTKTP